MESTKLKELNLLDKFLFDEAMEDQETYQMVVSILMENEVELLGRTETEKELRVSSEIRQGQTGCDRDGQGGKTLLYGNAKKKYRESGSQKPLLSGAARCVAA